MFDLWKPHGRGKDPTCRNLSSYLHRCAMALMSLYKINTSFVFISKVLWHCPTFCSSFIFGFIWGSFCSFPVHCLLFISTVSTLLVITLVHFLFIYKVSLWNVSCFVHYHIFMVFWTNCIVKFHTHTHTQNCNINITLTSFPTYYSHRLYDSAVISVLG